MKLSVAWANTMAQNVSLKVALICLSVCCFALSVCSVKLALKEPLIIERVCYSEVIKSAKSERTRSEIEAFVREAIRQRFNSDSSVQPTFLSQDEEVARQQEQKELSSRSMSQSVTVRSLDVKDNTVFIQADRLISVGEIRSAFSFPVNAVVQSVDRSASNPYGLQLSHIVSQKPQTNKPGF